MFYLLRGQANGRGERFYGQESLTANLGTCFGDGRLCSVLALVSSVDDLMVLIWRQILLGTSYASLAVDGVHHGAEMKISIAFPRRKESY